MMQLTQHQGRVGSVLQEGNHMIGEGKAGEGDEGDVRRQMELVNNRWENLRIKAMDRQSKWVVKAMMTMRHNCNHGDILSFWYIFDFTCN